MADFYTDPRLTMNAIDLFNLGRDHNSHHQTFLQQPNQFIPYGYQLPPVPPTPTYIGPQTYHTPEQQLNPRVSTRYSYPSPCILAPTPYAWPYTMASTRKAVPPLQIYQDEPFQQPTRVQQTNDALHRALGPLSGATLNQNINFNPSNTSSLGLSPTKHNGSSSSPPPEVLVDTNFNSILMPPPQDASAFTDSLRKTQSSFSPPTKSTLNPAAAPFMMYPVNPLHIDQENLYTPAIYNQNVQAQQGTFYGGKAPIEQTLMEAAPLQPLKDRTNTKGSSKNATVNQKATLKRTLSEASLLEPINDRANLKKAKLDESITALDPQDQQFDLPDPASLPDPIDDGPTNKPQYSYAQIIGMAILRAPARRLTLNQIYTWVAAHFSHFREHSKVQWQNSIRHNLSLNKSFEKQDRPKDDPGKGHYWIIKPGCEAQFLKDKPRRNTNSAPTPFISSNSDLPRPSSAHSVVAYPPPSTSKNIDSSKFPDETELSSDATILATDPNIHDGIDARTAAAAQAQNICSSPPAVQLCSSPPPVPAEAIPAAVRREATPPAVSRLPEKTRLPENKSSGGRKRKFGAVAGPGDSGYYSSLELSSIQKANRHIIFDDDDDHWEPPMRTIGRAEEAIARMRSSSYDSPSKTSQVARPSTAAELPTSSPFRPFENPKKAPLTPPVVFKKPARPVVSVSPNTNLKNHRAKIKKMLASPGASLAEPLIVPTDNAGSSLKVPTQTWLADGFSYDHFDAFTTPMQSPATRGSPEKRPTKRPRLERANTTDGVLTDITNSASNVSNCNVFESPVELSPSKSLFDAEDRCVVPLSPSWIRTGPDTPKKMPDWLSIPQFAGDFGMMPKELMYTNEELLAMGVNVSEFSSDPAEPGVDLTQGFQKIGHNADSYQV